MVLTNRVRSFFAVEVFLLLLRLLLPVLLLLEYVLDTLDFRVCELEALLCLLSC